MIVSSVVLMAQGVWQIWSEPSPAVCRAQKVLIPSGLLTPLPFGAGNNTKWIVLIVLLVLIVLCISTFSRWIHEHGHRQSN